MSERTVKTPLGELCITETDGYIIALSWRSGGNEETPLLLEAERQLSEYFAGRRKAFDLPLAPKGTPFQCAVWQALTEIPYGETRTYGEIAVAVGRDRAFRAVGMANHCNPIPVIIPCHRVIGANGSLTGYADGLERKARLLALEASNK